MKKLAEPAVRRVEQTRAGLSPRSEHSRTPVVGLYRVAITDLTLILPTQGTLLDGGAPVLNLRATPVPEPSTWPLMLLGFVALLALGSVGHRRRTGPRLNI